ncbi:hypothetical protein [Microbacterium sp. XT11]|uniref:hypothetical protein n=1 Tax=Microbacterium sp. XT11 TaxID=367477 RepID=UPI000836B25B|nr:hypothetical protein [Microbacterium sp. XT11]
MTDDLARWTAVLDRLERAVDDMPDAATWAEPPVGALPARLRARALALLERQQRAIDALVAARAGVARDIALIRRVPGARGDVPAYLDIEG